MGLLDKIKQGLAKTKQSMSVSMGSLFTAAPRIDEEFYDELEETLILADVGVETAEGAVEELREVVQRRELRTGVEVRDTLAEILAKRMKTGRLEMRLETFPSVILMVGVNGVGKTTTIGKLAAKYTAEGKKVLLCAADTFRAAAAEQLTVWAERSGCDIVRHEEGSDPAAVVYDGCAAARARGADIVIVDTAGRLHNKQNLMNELSKIRRILDKELPTCDVETLLVLDATTGQNGLFQAKSFKDSANITGVVLTKLDGTAKGGIVFAIAREMGIPVKFIGVGEQIDDLLPFDPKAFAEELLK